jgi:hypothetical protein
LTELRTWFWLTNRSQKPSPQRSVPVGEKRFNGSHLYNSPNYAGKERLMDAGVAALIVGLFAVVGIAKVRPDWLKGIE